MIKGRKRTSKPHRDNIKLLIETQAIPKWINYLRKKSDDSNKRESGIVPRDDTIWKKIFRDCREFYRILFKCRFHPLDYKSWEDADECTKVILNELGISTDALQHHEVRKIFYYFHQTRLNSSDHYKLNYPIDESIIYGVDIIEKYKDVVKTLFMVDPVCSKLFYILFHNYDKLYFEFLKEKYLGIIDIVIRKVVSCYDNIQQKQELVKVVDSIF